MLNHGIFFSFAFGFNKVLPEWLAN